MTNIFAVVEAPALDITLDVIIPTHLTVAQVISLLVKIVYTTAHVKLQEDKLILCDIDSGRILSRFEPISIFQLKDACRLAVV